ncbi:MAG: class I SAM-dependent methyltransferase [Lachnospiraceae bacterium]|nr:class I SAM-dependent methyltransferase [Lachnospiraceae bacterium]
MKSFDTTWETIHATQEWGKYPAEPVIRFVARNYYNKVRRTIKILDFCCGAGSNTWYLAREGFDVYAFDGSVSAVNKVEKRLEKENLKADLRVLDACEINYKDNFFDCVIDNVSIYANKYENIVNMYTEIYQILKNEGKIFTSVFSKNTTGYGMGEEIEKDTFINIPCGNVAGRGTVHFFEVNDIKKLLAQIGYRNIRTDILCFTDNQNIVEQILVQAEK